MEHVVIGIVSCFASLGAIVIGVGIKNWLGGRPFFGRLFK